MIITRLIRRFFPTMELYYSHKQLHEAGTLAPSGTTMQTDTNLLYNQDDNDTKREHFIESVKSLTCPTCGKVRINR